MRRFGNALQQYYGTVSITPPTTGVVGLSVNQNTSIPGISVTSLNAVDASLQIAQLGVVTWKLYNPASSGDLRLFQTSDRVVFTANGNVSINAPASGAALSITGVARGAYGPSVQITAPNTTDQSNGLNIKAGTSVNDAPFVVSNAAGTVNYYALLGDGEWSMQRSSGAQTLAIGPSGNMSLGAPSSGIAFTVNGLAGATSLSVLAGSTAAVDIGVNRSSAGTANTLTAGPNIVLSGTTWGTTLQSSGNQTEIWQFNSSWVQRLMIDTSGNVNIANGSGALSPVYSGIPQNNQNSNYTLVLADANKHMLHNAGGAITYTIPANATVAFPIGTAITFVNATGAGILTLSFGDTVQFYPSGGSGNRTVATNGQVTALKIAATVWSVTGVGVT